MAVVLVVARLVKSFNFVTSLGANIILNPAAAATAELAESAFINAKLLLERVCLSAG